MKQLLIQYGRWFLLAFVAGFVLPRANPAFFLADTVNNPYDDYTKLEDALVEYHLSSNTITNTYLEQLLNSENAKLGYVEYPPDDSECDGKNVSTYCLAVVLNQNLTQFEDSMIARVDQFNLEDGDFSDVTDLQTALEQSTSQKELIQEQISTAEDALDLNLAIYNQIQTVYPLHVELAKFIKNLEGYRDGLGKLRSSLSPYPAKFNGTTSTECK